MSRNATSGCKASKSVATSENNRLLCSCLGGIVSAMVIVQIPTLDANEHRTVDSCLACPRQSPLLGARPFVCRRWSASSFRRRSHMTTGRAIRILSYPIGVIYWPPPTLGCGYGRAISQALELTPNRRRRHRPKSGSRAGERKGLPYGRHTGDTVARQLVLQL